MSIFPLFKPDIKKSTEKNRIKDHTLISYIYKQFDAKIIYNK